jgi:hypothetical protein
MKSFKLLLLSALLTFSSLSSFSIDPTSGIIYGETDTTYWNLDYSTGVLEITGKGVVVQDNRNHFRPHRDFIKSLSIGEGITEIQSDRFYELNLLESVSFPKSLLKLNQRVFLLCTSLKSVTIPENVTFLGHSLFSYCTSLTKINFLGAKPPVFETTDFNETTDFKNPFSNLNLENLIVTVPDASLAAYQATSIFKTLPIKIGVPVQSVLLSPDFVSAKVGEFVRFTVSVLPRFAADKRVSFIISDSQVATVSQDGLVTALSEGTVIVTAVTEEGSFESSATLTVVAPTGLARFPSLNPLSYKDAVKLFRDGSALRLTLPSPERVSVFSTLGSLLYCTDLSAGTHTLSLRFPDTLVVLGSSGWVRRVLAH